LEATGEVVVVEVDVDVDVNDELSLIPLSAVDADATTRPVSASITCAYAFLLLVHALRKCAARWTREYDIVVGVRSRERIDRTSTASGDRSKEEKK